MLFEEQSTDIIKLIIREFNTS